MVSDHVFPRDPWTVGAAVYAHGPTPEANRAAILTDFPADTNGVKLGVISSSGIGVIFVLGICIGVIFNVPFGVQFIGCVVIFAHGVTVRTRPRVSLGRWFTLRAGRAA